MAASRATSTRSRAKAPNKTERRGARQKMDSVEGGLGLLASMVWPTDENGEPMAQISITASELIPTGDFANVVVGPVTVTKFVKDDKLADRLNELAEMVESDCIAEQRVIVLQSLQAKVEDKK